LADTPEQRIAHLSERLRDSRRQLVELAEAMRGERPPPGEPAEEQKHGGFPHSRLMRALMGKPVGVALGTAAVAATMMRPRLLLGALRFTPMLRPLLMRYVLPRLLGQR
jgi:hypothetical protein